MSEMTAPRLPTGGTGYEPEAIASQARFLEAALSSIPDYVYAFDRQRRFAYANPAMLALFGLSAKEMIGQTFADLDYPEDLAALLNGHIDRILATGETIQNEVFFQSPTGHAAYFDYFWAPVRDQDGDVALVVGVSRDTSERRGMEEALRRSEARLRAATELVGIGIYAWDPVSGALEWDDRLRAMWDLPPDAPVDLATFEGGIHPDDRARVHAAINACADPAGDGLYKVEYRVVGQCDGQTRHVLSSGRTTFTDGRATGFIGAALDVTEQRAIEAATRISEAQFRSFAAHSSNLIWLGDPVAGTITYRSAAFQRIWGVPLEEGKDKLTDWMQDVHPDDRGQVEHALAAVAGGEVIQFEYRLIRPADGALRWLRDTSFPILDDAGGVRQIGGITEDLTQGNVRHVYIVSRRPAEARRLGGIVRSLGLHARTFDDAAAFLDIAAVLTPGCVLVDLRHARQECLAVPRELKARSIALPTIVLDSPDADRDAVLAAMKAGAGDYLILNDDAAFRSGLEAALDEARGAARPSGADDTASARLGRLTPREREVLGCLVDGNTNKIIGQRLGISPRTVELHRAQVMSRLNASTLAELVQIAMSAGITSSTSRTETKRNST
jgi:PAS domain S-box-containing protein